MNLLMQLRFRLAELGHKIIIQKDRIRGDWIVYVPGARVFVIDQWLVHKPMIYYTDTWEDARDLAETVLWVSGTSGAKPFR